VVDLTARQKTARLTIEWRDKALAPLLIPQGSVAVDGVSLTVARLNARDFEIMITRTRWPRPRWGASGRAAREPRDGYDRQVRAENPAGQGGRSVSQAEFVSIEEGIERSAPDACSSWWTTKIAENEGDLLNGRREGDAGGGQLHGQVRPRAHLHADAGERLDELQISMMVSDNTSRRSAPPSR